MDKKLQVFISSTYTDLIEERQVAVEAILSAGHIPAGMELFKAGPTQEQVIREWIDQSDVYMLILGARYGSKREDGISYTEWEYELAKKLKKPMFSIVLDNEYVNKQVDDKRIKATEVERSGDQFSKFRKNVESNLMIPINHIAEIKSGILGTLNDIEKRYAESLIGWIPGTFMDKIDELKAENKVLSDKLLDRQDEVIILQKEVSFVKDDYIGPYSFDFIFKAFCENEIPIKKIENTIDDYMQELKINRGKGLTMPSGEINLKRLNALKENNIIIDVLFDNKEKFFKKEFLYGNSPISKIYKKYFFPYLIKYNLGGLTNQFGKSRVTFDLNENGFKFLNLIEVKGIKT